MEPDSTTHDALKATLDDAGLPFLPSPGNLRLYKELTSTNGDQRMECQLVERMQNLGLLPDRLSCPAGQPDCRMLCKPARVVDRMQWVCKGCGRRLPIRSGSFFMHLSCSMLQALQVILAWTEDIDCDVMVQSFGIKPKVAGAIYDKLDALAVKEQQKLKLGGEGSVVLTEMYPDCLTRLSPDTTDQPHMHRILIIADTNHIPTHYQLHLIKCDLKKKLNSRKHNETLIAEMEEALSLVTRPGSMIVSGTHVPLNDASSIQQLVQHCDTEMTQFLTSRIWRQAMLVCAASRDLCAGVNTPSSACAAAVQRYLDAALYRLRHNDGFYGHVLGVLADACARACARADTQVQQSTARQAIHFDLCIARILIAVRSTIVLQVYTMMCGLLYPLALLIVGSVTRALYIIYMYLK